MPKARKPAPKRPPTKHQLARWQRQKKQNRIAQIVAALALVAVLAVLGWGYYSTQLRPFHRPALKVNDTTVDMGYYARVLALSIAGQDPTNWNSIADQTVPFIQTNTLLIQGALQLGVKIEDSKIESELKARGSEDDPIRRDILRAELLRDKVREEYFKPSIPASAEQVHVNALLLRSKEEAAGATQRLKSGESFAALAQELSQDAVSKDKGGDLGWLVKGTRSEEFDAAAFALKPNAVSEPFFDPSELAQGGLWIIKPVEKKDDQVRLKGILLREKGDAEKVASRLKEGQDFDALVTEFSEDVITKETGGDLGWISKDTKAKDFEDVAFSLELDAWGGPVFDATALLRGGYWVLQVRETDPNRAVDDDTREALAGQALNRWFAELMEKSTLENYLDPDKKVWALTQAVK